MYDRALKLIRQYHALSQTELSESIGFSKSFVSELESGRKKPSIDVLEKYAKRFQIPLSSLLLFSERSSSGLVENTRIMAAGKVLKMLEWLRDTADERAA